MTNVANFPLLSLILFLPLAGAIIAALRSEGERQRDSVDCQSLRSGWVPGVGAVVVLVQHAGSELSVRRADAVDPVDRRAVLPRRRRFQRASRAAGDAVWFYRHSVVVDRHHRASEGVLHLPAHPADGHDRRVCESRLPPVLPVLGSDARADVFSHRHLGQRPPALFGDQVLPLYPRRQRRDAAGNSGTLLLQPQRDGRIHVRHHAISADERAVQPAVVGVPRFLPRLRSQSADVPVPHVVAGCAYRCADGRFGDSCRGSSEDGHLRVYPVLAADSSGRDAAFRTDDGDARDCRNRVRCACAPWRSRIGSGSSPIPA